MQPPQSEATPGESDLNIAIHERLKGIKSGKYRASTEHILTEFAQWLQQERDVDPLSELTSTDCRRYAQYLRDRVRNEEQDLSASSANTYYAYVHAFLSWCVCNGREEMNPAAIEELPEDSDRPDR